MSEPAPLGADELLRRAEAAPSRAEAVPPAEAEVHRWVWTRASSPRGWLTPHRPERIGRRPGRDFRRPPRRLRDVEAYGYDAHGRLLVGRRYLNEEDVEVQVVRHDGAEALAFAYPSFLFGGLERLSRYVADESGRVVLAEHAQPPSPVRYVAEVLRYDGAGRLESVEFFLDDRDWGRPLRGVERLTFDGDRLLRVVTEFADGRTRQTYAHVTPSGPPLDELQAAITRAVVAARPDEPACMLALRYLPGGPLPPFVNLCFDRDWARLAASGDPFSALNPAEWRDSELDLALDDGTAAACAAVGESSRARAWTRTLAARLRGEDWTRLRAVTDDFLVYTVDVDLADLERKLDTPLGLRQRRLFR